MAAKSTAKDKKWFVDLCEKGCQICGAKFPNMKNNGLHWSHIISKKDGGNDEEVNCMALCPNCSFTFDLVIKPAIYMAVEKFNNSTIPESWKNGENRKSMRIRP